MATKKRAKTVRQDNAPRLLPAMRVESRTDGWTNILTKLGTARDKRSANFFRENLIAHDRQYQEALWRGDDMFARIVETRPKHMLRAGFVVQIQSDAMDAGKGGVEGARGDAFPPSNGGNGIPFVPPAPKKPPGVIEPKNTEENDTADAVLARLEELRGRERLRESLNYREAYGGGGIFVGADDGATDLTQPLDLERIKTLKWLNVLTPRELVVVRYYGDPREPKYGEPEIYRVQTTIALPNTASAKGADVNLPPPIFEIHESRIIPFSGPVTSTRHRFERHGWGDSGLARVLDVLSDFNMTHTAGAHLMHDFAQAVLKMKGLAELMAQGDDDVIRKRAEILDMTRSVARMVMIDGEDEFERKATPLSGLPEMLDKQWTRLAAAARMPVTLLAGEAPAGLNATGDSDVRAFYDDVAAEQQDVLKPGLERLIRLIFRAKDGPTKGVEPENWHVKFNPLWQLTDGEEATKRKMVADADVAYVNAGVLTAEEVAASRWGGRSWSMETTIDLEGRQALADAHNEATDERTAQLAAAAKTQPPFRKPDPNSGEAGKSTPPPTVDPPTDVEA